MEEVKNNTKEELRTAKIGIDNSIELISAERMGSYVKVTNTANGKSVIVKINDRGPFGAGRIIDLDKVAFQEIASLGQGVINVKMEEITN